VRERESIEKSLLRRQIRARRARALATIARVDDPLSERARIYVYVLWARCARSELEKKNIHHSCVRTSLFSNTFAGQIYTYGV